MKYKSTIVLFVIAVALAFYIFVVEVNLKTTEERAQENLAVFDYDMANINKLHITRPEGVLTIEKKDDTWFITEPVNWRADESKVRRILSRVSELKRKRSDMTKSNLADYGLADSGKIQLTFWVNSEKVPLFLGNLDPSEANVYVKLAEDSNNVVVVDKGIRDSLTLPAGDYRDKNFLKVSKYTAATLDITNPNTAFTIAKQDDNWIINAPVKTRADKKTIEDTFDELQDTTVDDFVDDNPQDLSKYGLDAPPVSVTVVDEYGDTVTAHFGKRLEDDMSRVYAKLEGFAPVCAVSYSTMNALDKTLRELRDMKLVRFDKNNVFKLDIAAKGQDITLTKLDNQWRLTAPINHKADEPTVMSLISAIVNDDVIDVVADAPEDISQYGLAAPEATLTFNLDATGSGEEAPSVTILVGDKTPDGAKAYVKLKDFPSVYTVSNTIYSQATQTYLAYRDKHILDLKTSNIVSFTLARPDRTYVVEQTGSGKWSITQPVAAAADTSNVSYLVRSFSTLRARAIVSDNAPDEQTQYGLDNPEITLTFTLKRPVASPPATADAVGGEEPNTTQRTVLVGPVQADGLAYAMVKGSEYIIALEPYDRKVLDDELVTRRIFDFATFNVVSVDFNGTLCVRNDKIWTITKPDEAPANGEVIQRALDELANLRTTKYVTFKKSPLEKFGIAEPSYTITFITKDASYTLLLGGLAGDDFYAKTGDSDWVFTVPMHSSENLLLSPKDLIQPQSESQPNPQSGGEAGQTASETGVETPSSGTGAQAQPKSDETSADVLPEAAPTAPPQAQ